MLNLIGNVIMNFWFFYSIISQLFYSIVSTEKSDKK